MAGEQVFDAVIEAIAKKQCYSAIMPQAASSAPVMARHALTRAELDVLHGMLEGQSYEKIAAALGREHGTVRSQAASMYDKLDVRSRGQAVRKALQLGILHL